MLNDYFYINSAFLRSSGRPGSNKYILVIETDLSLPQQGQQSHEMDTLLTEIGDLKENNPFIFEEIESVEIRHREDPDMPFRLAGNVIDLNRVVASRKNLSEPVMSG